MIKYLIVHHTGGTDSNPLADTSHHTFEIVNTAHKNNPRINLGHPSTLGYYIGYQYFISKAGIVTQGRADTEEGAHAVGYNSNSVGICLAGNFDLTLPTEAQKEALKSLLRRLIALYSVDIANVVPHRTFANKSCYGAKLSDSWARDLLREDAKITLMKQIIEAASKAVALLKRLLQTKTRIA